MDKNMQFRMKHNELYCEDVRLADIAEKIPTPFFVYSRAALEQAYRTFEGAFRALDPMICYSVKALSNRAVLRVFRRLGAGFDIVSGGELFRARRAGADMRKVVYAGVAKSEKEITASLRAGIHMFNCESVSEMRRIDILAGRLGKKARIAARVNPDVKADTHHHITTGTKENKFGILFGSLLAHLEEIRSMKSLVFRGLDMHIGSQINNPATYGRALKKLTGYARTLERKGMAIDTINLGGGYGITYDRERPMDLKRLAAVIRSVLKGSPYRLIIEPGRILTGNAGVLVTQVQYQKRGSHKNFLICDAGIHNLIRPPLYGAYHGILPLRLNRGKGVRWDVVGPICESTDYFAKSRILPPVEEGDLLAVLSAGAYSSVMESHYNSHPLAAEVMVEGGRFRTVRRSGTYGQMVQNESLL